MAGPVTISFPQQLRSKIRRGSDGAGLLPEGFEMKIFRLIERFIPERQDIDTLSKRLFTDLQRLPDDPSYGGDVIKVGDELAGRPNGKQQKEIIEAVKSLSPRQQTALLLHSEFQLNYKQIAKRMQITDQLALAEVTAAYSSLREKGIR